MHYETNSIILLLNVSFIILQHKNSGAQGLHTKTDQMKQKHHKEASILHVMCPLGFKT